MRSYKRNDKPVCTAAARFLGQLINQGVAHEVLALEMLILMLEQPSADSVEMACEFVKEVGAYLQDVAPQGLHG
jgi:pre-mRNA-splicing factor CWC22